MIMLERPGRDVHLHRVDQLIEDAHCATAKGAFPRDIAVSVDRTEGARDFQTGQDEQRE